MDKLTFIALALPTVVGIIVFVGAYMYTVDYAAERVEFYSEPINCATASLEPDKYFPRYKTPLETYEYCHKWNDDRRLVLLKHYQMAPTTFLVALGIIGILPLAMLGMARFSGDGASYDVVQTAPCKDNFDNSGAVKNTKCCNDTKIIKIPKN